MNKCLPLFGIVAVACVCGGFAAGMNAQDPSASVTAAQHRFTKDMTVWVRDFDLDASKVQVDQGSVVNQVRPGLIERPRKREQHDPEAQAKKLVDTMSSSLVDDLHKAGYKATRLRPGDPSPPSGVLVHGVFTEVDEGNRIHRALIGFGSGKSTMSLYVTMSDLAQPEKPLYDLADKESSGKKPGAVITLNPYVAAAKFILEKNAPEKTVKKTASDISAQVVEHLKQAEAPKAGR